MKTYTQDLTTDNTAPAHVSTIANRLTGSIKTRISATNITMKVEKRPLTCLGSHDGNLNPCQETVLVFGARLEVDSS